MLSKDKQLVLKANIIPDNVMGIISTYSAKSYLFKVSYKNTRTTSIRLFWCL